MCKEEFWFNLELGLNTLRNKLLNVLKPSLKQSLRYVLGFVAKATSLRHALI